jgi:hypothetical protein
VLEEVYNEGEPFVPISEFYPSRERHRVTVNSYRRLPKELAAIYQEVISSFNHELNLLCAVGLRALLEGVCQDKGIKGQNLKQRIEGLKTLLPENIVDGLHGFRFLGNEAVHELEAPNQYRLKLYIDVVEDLLNYLYELEYKASRLSPEKRKGPKKPHQ